MVSSEMYDVNRMMAKVWASRGPARGEGRGPGRPWRGIVENTPCLWVTWIVEACKRTARPVPEAITADGRRVLLVSVRLTFGQRYYFIAPCCGRRVEVLYFLPLGEVGCRQCLHIGYLSQTYRRGSIWALLDGTWQRHMEHRLSRRRERGGLATEVVTRAVDEVRGLLRESIEAMLSRVSVDPIDTGQELEG